MKFEFIQSELEQVNLDSDLFYDLTDGGYIKPEKLLTDKELAAKVSEAAKLVRDFINAMTDEMEF